jgi:hypothetical protein
VTKSIRAVVSISTFVIKYQYYLFSVKKFVHTCKKKTHINQSSQKHENSSTILQGNFALVPYAGKRSNRFFVGQVTYGCKVL